MIHNYTATSEVSTSTRYSSVWWSSETKLSLVYYGHFGQEFADSPPPPAA